MFNSNEWQIMVLVRILGGCQIERERQTDRQTDRQGQRETERERESVCVRMRAL